MKYITTAIAYLNGAPHVGHALDYLLADIWARRQRNLGEEVRFQAGTDEHGQKVAKKAAELGLEPAELVDKNAKLFRELLQKMNASNTNFIRTSSEAHKRRCQDIWRKLAAAGHIYKSAYEGWYCEGCESFFTNSEVEENHGVCPIHHQPFVKLKEENYFLKMSEFLPRIRAALEKGLKMSVEEAANSADSDFIKIVPDFRAKEILNLLEDMPDVSISRPKTQVAWGISVPDDAEQTMYVWIDALSNYITGLGYPDEFEVRFWPASVQVIGKDILRFHAAIWPAILLGLGLKLPKILLVHGFVSMNGEKMSKSLGNVVSPDEIMEKYGADAFRYYFARHVPTVDDGDFTWKKFENAYNGELANELGNLVSRVANMANKYFDGKIALSSGCAINAKKSQELMVKLQFSEALEAIWGQVRQQNKLIDDKKPWKMAKNDEKKPELQKLLVVLVQNIVAISEELDPFLPEATEKIRKIFTPHGVKYDGEILFPKTA
ncbi:MAG: methionine--tRNA ligase [Candidatus Nomurabacteria bacterium]|jgi:methionyl-tRNA synthetase|nr:methionine--tRNA ligase [Candidatus Nomurabacteria bacterium]